MNTSPSMKGKARKLCANLPICEMNAKASAPSSGITSVLPNEMFSPVRASTMKQPAVSQCTKRSKPLKRRMNLPDGPAPIGMRPRTK